jgi:hypothetical protein
MKEIQLIFRFLLGGGWWTVWYGLFYLIIIAGNFLQFNELYDWAKKGQSGPAGGGVFMVLIMFSGLPVVGFFIIHLLFAFFRSAHSFVFLLIFGLIILVALLIWMIAGAASIAEARYSAFVWYYVALFVFIFINLALLWISRQKSELGSFIPFLP